MIVWGYGGSIPPKAQHSTVVQLVECQSVTLVVAGSSPVGTAMIVIVRVDNWWVAIINQSMYVV